MVKGIELLDAELARNDLVCLTERDFGAAGELTPDSEKGCYRHNIDHICVTDHAFEVEKVG